MGCYPTEIYESCSTTDRLAEMRETQMENRQIHSGIGSCGVNTL